MFSDFSDDARWVLMASSTGIALSVYFLFFRVLFKGSASKDSPPVAPTGVLETIKEISGPNAPWYVIEMAKKTGSLIYKIRLPLPGGVYVIGDSQAQREVFLDKTTDKPEQMFKTFSKIGGTPNIFTRVNTDPLWRAARKGSAAAFSPKEVARMNRICSEHVEHWIQNTLKTLADNNQTFDPSEHMIRLTFRIIMESAFEYSPTDQEYKEFVHHLEIALKEFTLKQSVNPFRSTFGIFIPQVRQAAQSCIMVRRFCQKILDAYRANPNKSPQHTLIKLIDQIPQFDDANKVSEIVTFLTAGFDTTGYTLASTLVLLAKHPEIGRKARESLLSQGANNTKSSDYMRQVVLESNRLIPVAAMGSFRQAGRDYTFNVGPKKDCTVRIPKGAKLFLPQIVANYDASVYSEPESFQPERWSTASKNGLLTFALGSRSCIGQSLAMAELDTVLPRILSEYSFEIVENGKLDFFLTLKFSGTRLRATRLQKE